MLGEETCLPQRSERFFRASWSIPAHKQMGYGLKRITEGCSCLTRRGGGNVPRGVLKQAIAKDHTFLK